MFDIAVHTRNSVMQRRESRRILTGSPDLRLPIHNMRLGTNRSSSLTEKKRSFRPLGEAKRENIQKRVSRTFIPEQTSAIFPTGAWERSGGRKLAQESFFGRGCWPKRLSACLRHGCVLSTACGQPENINPRTVLSGDGRVDGTDFSARTIRKTSRIKEKADSPYNWTVVAKTRIASFSRIMKVSSWSHLNLFFEENYPITLAAYKTSVYYWHSHCIAVNRIFR